MNKKIDKKVRGILVMAGQLTSKYPEKKCLAGDTTFIHATQYDDVTQKIVELFKAVRGSE